MKVQHQFEFSYAFICFLKLSDKSYFLAVIWKFNVHLFLSSSIICLPLGIRLPSLAPYLPIAAYEIWLA